ncbi:MULTISPECIES: hypothetical protein [Paenibacillus]|uniref:Uncharacterized protein n=1 Tax=Paenibacillus kribbensis TaxID=172713 RepID=A0A222WPU0_9BACL|nr:MULTISPECIES: hypothetical protein [Paenibacillus]ASR48557.1 hypothetical protein B4V02_18540 [Paenibacillus kribbensis]
MNLLTLSKEIREGKISDDKLVECLDIHHNQVMMNAMSQIAKKKLCNEKIIEKLKHISQFRDPKVNKLFGIDTLGHYSIAVLRVLNTSESIKQYDLLMAELDDFDKEIVERIAEGIG